jgi:hypothetical protein
VCVFFAIGNQDTSTVLSIIYKTPFEAFGSSQPLNETIRIHTHLFHSDDTNRIIEKDFAPLWCVDITFDGCKSDGFTLKEGGVCV